MHGQAPALLFKIHVSSGDLSNWVFYGCEDYLRILDMQDSIRASELLSSARKQAISICGSSDTHRNDRKLASLLRHGLLSLHSFL